LRVSGFEELAAESVRSGWSEAFVQIASVGEDRLLDEPTPARFDDEEWEW